jgi:hypothetical protein
MPVARTEQSNGLLYRALLESAPLTSDDLRGSKIASYLKDWQKAKQRIESGKAFTGDAYTVKKLTAKLKGLGFFQ